MKLTVDMALKNFGWAAIENGCPVAVGVIQSKKTKDKKKRKSLDYTHRITHLADELLKLFRKYRPTHVTGEMPTFGSQSTDAAVSLTASSAVMLTLLNAFKTPVVWVTPEECKLSFTGSKTASKVDMMIEACKRNGWDITYKPIKDKKTQEVIRVDAIYHVLGEALPGSKFEHIADAIAAYDAVKV